MSAITGVAGNVRTLGARSDALRAQCEALAASSSDDPTRATLARVAGRLASSVIAPLTAALQDLSCQAVADDAERLEARRTKLTAFMSGLPAMIQSAPNGPYLLTNVTRLSHPSAPLSSNAGSNPASSPRTRPR